MSTDKIERRRLTRGSQPARANVAGKGRFAKGHKKVGGRKKGVRNVVTRDIREAIVNAAIRHGEDGEGKGGLEGYLFTLAREDKRAFGGLLRAVMPMQFNASIETSLNVQYKSLEEANAEARRLGLPDGRVFELTDYRRVEHEPDKPPSAR
jgi:hypothetical protein